MKKLGLGRSLERALSKSIGFISSVILFLVAISLSIKIDTSFIFSILVATGAIKFFAIYSILGIDLLHELHISFDRFASIFNIEEPLKREEKEPEVRRREE